MSAIAPCPDSLPQNLQELADQLARTWISSPLRPSVAPPTLSHWSRLVSAWADDHQMPLYVRKSKGNRGSALEHESGRTLVPVDNSAAHWAIATALRGTCPPLTDVTRMIECDEIPVAMALSRDERGRARYTCNRIEVNLNTLGWKVCHIRPVGLRSRGDISTLPLADLKQHFVDCMSPANMFLVPKAWSGLGEIPEMVRAAAADVGGK